MKDMDYRVAVVGATGAVGQKVLRVLEERSFPVRELVPFASPRSEGMPVTFQDRQLACRALSADAIDGFDLAFFAAGGSVSAEWAPRFAERDAVAIDKSSFWRMDPEVPLVVPEINPDATEQALAPGGKRIVASPNCSTMAMVMALYPIHRVSPIEEIVVSTYQSVSGTGRAAVDELLGQAHTLLHGSDPGPPSVYPHQIAFNALPHVETFKDSSGYTTEERKMMFETRKIFGLGEEQLAITATCVRVPVIHSHSEAIRIRTREPVSVERARELLEDAPGVIVVDDPERNEYPLAIDAADRDEVFVGRLRHDPGAHGTGHLNLWVVGDNLRKGAATNAVQIAQLLHERGVAGTEERAAHDVAVAR
jgi:aspartate-semialdehyde dehydrogenase